MQPSASLHLMVSCATKITSTANDNNNNNTTNNDDDDDTTTYNNNNDRPSCSSRGSGPARTTSG
jgi:hypothetical protein